MKRLLCGSRRETGASLVEFALVAPLLFMLLFGMIEFGWAFAQNLDVKHMAREVGRLATVDATEPEVIGAACANDIVNASDVTVISRFGWHGRRRYRHRHDHSQPPRTDRHVGLGLRQRRQPHLDS